MPPTGAPNPVAHEAARSVLVRAYPRTGTDTGTLPVAPDHRQDGDPKRDESRLGAHADATITPDGVTTNGRADLTEVVSSVKCNVLSEESPAAGLLTSHFTLQTSNSTLSASDKPCETNPIGTGTKEGQVFDEKGVTSDPVPNGLEKTNPILGEGAMRANREIAGPRDRFPAGKVLVAGPAG